MKEGRKEGRPDKFILEGGKIKEGRKEGRVIKEGGKKGRKQARKEGSK